MVACPLPPQCSQQENQRLCDVISAFVNWNALKIGDSDRPHLLFQKLRLNRALKKGTT